MGSTMESNYDFRHVLILNLATILVSSSAIFAKLITLNPGQVVLFRCLIGGFFLGLFLKFRGVQLWPVFKQYWGFFLITGFFLGIHWVLLFWAIQISTVSVTILAVFTFPVITTLLEPLFFKMKLVWFNLVTAGLILLGISFLVPEYSLENQISLGVLLGVLSAVLISVRNLLCKKYIQKISGPEMMFFQVGVSAVILLPTLFIERPDLNVQNVAYLVSMGLVTTALGHTIFVYCLKFFRTSTASIITSIQPFYGIVLAMIFLKETPGTNIFIGGAMIVGTVILENVKAGLRPRVKKN